MGAVASMIQKLAPLGVYALQQNSTVYKELCAYAAALDILEATLLQAQQECFICTAQSYGLSHREINIGPVREELTLEKRREMLLSRAALKQDDFNRSGVEQMLSALGLEFTLFELPHQQTLHIDCKGSYTQAQRKWISSQPIAQLPAHLDVLLDFRNLQWSTIDAKNLTFASMDAKAMTWKQIESYGV